MREKSNSKYVVNVAEAVAMFIGGPVPIAAAAR
jgi:hypothetical protein